jgi:transcription elongation factor GreA
MKRRRFQKNINIFYLFSYTECTKYLLKYLYVEVYQYNLHKKRWILKGVYKMANEKKFPMTLAGKEKLEQELETLKTVKRAEVVERIKIARSFGDLSENSEYDAAKDEQAFVEGRITTLENMVRNAEIITANSEASNVVTLGKSVTFLELPEGDEETYTIVGSAEADPFEGKISNDSPIARSLLGKQIGDEVTVSTPGGDMQVKIIAVK